MANPPSSVGRYIDRLLKDAPPRAKSLCVSLLGDALACHGGAIWLGGIIELLEPLGINERLLRTSVFRLVAQGWLQAERHGRRSLYQLSEQGRRHTAHASQRIYDGPAADWAMRWPATGAPSGWAASSSCSSRWASTNGCCAPACSGWWRKAGCRPSGTDAAACTSCPSRAGAIPRTPRSASTTGRRPTGTANGPWW